MTILNHHSSPRRHRRPHHLSRLQLLACESLEPRFVLAAEPILLVESLGVSASSLFNVGGTFFYVASSVGYFDGELWKTDGTQSGTGVVKDIFPGLDPSYPPEWGHLASSSPNSFTNLNGTLLFTANDGIHGTELWRSDGTAAGTTLVKDIHPGSSNGPIFNYGYPSNKGLTTIDGTAYFIADDGTHGPELWKSDGTETGTVLVKDINPGAGAFSYNNSLLNIGGTLFFVANDGVHGYELWKSDGTELGTQLVADIRPGPASSELEKLTDVNGAIFFRATDGINGVEIWETDGTAAGTMMLKDLRTGSFGSYPENLKNVDGTLYFTTAIQNEYSMELWKSDGTEAGTVLVKSEIPSAPSGLPNNLTNVNGTLFFVAHYEHPWGTYASVLWKSDGTEAGTVAVKEMPPDEYNILQSAYMPMESVDGELYFIVTGNVLMGVPGGDLWKSDGTESGTVPITQHSNFESGIESLVVIDETVYYISYEASGMSRQLWMLPPPNETPLATNDQVIVAQGSAANVLQVLANDNDEDNEPLVIQSVGPTARNATVTLNESQTAILYTPRTPTSTGIDTFSYTVVDAAGAISTATVTVTILANTVVVEPSSLHAEVLAQQTTSDEPLDVVVNVTPVSYDAVIAAINSLPPVSADGQSVFVTLAVSDGTYHGAVISPPPGVVVILNGYGGNITLVGASPALTVSSGEVIVQNGMILTNSTDAPTILVTGGHLIVRNSTIEESTNFARAAIEITGGTVDLGTTDSPGGNTFIVHGAGIFIQNSTGSPAPAVGNAFLNDSPGNDPPTIIAIQEQQYTETELTFPLTATDPESDPLTYNVTYVSKAGGGAVNVPSGFSIDNAGLFHWTPGAGQLGQYTFLATVSDGEHQASQHFTINTLGIVNGVLTIVGTDGVDEIIVKPTDGDIESLSVRINEVDLDFKLRPKRNPDNPYLGVERVVIHALGGNDFVDLRNQLQVDAEIHGGAGDDILKGADGHDVIFGGSGQDQLWGGDGNDFLVGGDGQDRLQGQKGNDVLVAGRFASDFDVSFLNLRAISAAWAVGLADVDLSNADDENDLLDESAGDQLVGGQGADWFIAMVNDLTDFNSKRNKDGDLLTII